MPPALTERFQVLRGRLAPCRCTWPWWLDGSFGLPFHEIFVALGSSPAREKWPSTAGQRNRSLERQNALHSVRFCITNLLVKPETDPVVNNAMHGSCFGSEKFQQKKENVDKTFVETCIFSASNCQATRLFVAIHGHLVDGQVRPPAEGAAQRQTRCLQRQHLVDAKSMDGWMPWCLAKLGKSMEVL